jgi:molecular chaperone IbpA
MTRLQTLNIPNLHRASIGFDQMFDELERSFANTPNSQGYPPYNIAQINEDEYMISVAVAGFGMDNLDITKDGKILRIEGTSPKGDEDVNYLHKGIGGRNFRREFTLVRELPEELQPKKIDITDHSLVENQ